MRTSDHWTEEQLVEWVGERVYSRARRLLATTPVRMRRDEPDYLEAFFEEKGGPVQTMLAPAELPERSRLTCSCPEFEEGPCRHAAALVLYARGERPAAPQPPPAFAKAGPNNNEDKLQAALAKVAATRRALSQDGERILGFQIKFALGEPMILEGARLRPGSKLVEGIPAGSLVDHAPPFADEAARGLLDALRFYQQGRRFVVPEEALDGVLPALRGAHVFMKDPTQPLQWSDRPLTLAFHSSDLRDGIAVAGRALDADGREVPLTPHARLLQAGQGCWLYDGHHTLHRLTVDRPTLTLESLLPGPYYVTPHEFERWLLELIPAMRQWGQLTIGDTRSPEVVEVAPKPAVVLEEVQGSLRIAPQFRYPPAKQLVALGTGTSFIEERRWFVRDLDAEVHFAKMLTALLITEPKDSSGRWMLPADRALLFLDDELKKLTASGWDVFGEESFKELRFAPGELLPSVRVQSGLDWFDVNFEFALGDERFDGWKLLAEWDRNRKFLRTANGYVRLPAELLQKLRERLSDLPEGGRLRRSQAGVVAGLLGEMPAADLDQGWRETAKALENLQHPETIPVPAGLQAQLRPYQQAGFDWLVFLARNRFGGILADDMGLGKTLQTITFLLHDLREGEGRQALVVCPSSVVFNWEREIQKFAPALRVFRWTGEQRWGREEELASADVVLTNYAILRRDVELLAGKTWRALVLDEAQAIKNAGSQTAESARVIPAEVRIALSGTPIENQLNELWSYFEFLMPGFFGGLKNFTDLYTKQFDQASVREKLRKRVAPFILRRLKQNVASELPPKTEIVLDCEFGEAQRNAYESIRAAYKMSLFERIEKDGLAKSRIHVLEALLRLRQACCDPRLLPYDHTRDIQESAKREALFELMEDAVQEGHKMIVFSQFTEMLDLLEAGARERGIEHVRLDGSTADREAPVTRFQTDPACKVIFVSLRAGGTGLNLTAADYVVHYDPWWNPAVEDQATDRAYRIGQTRPVFVYKLVVRGTVEETMVELQQKKRGIVDGLLGEGGLADALNVEDLREIFG
jgi:superfamily II DNA or RNA helicase